MREISAAFSIVIFSLFTLLVVLIAWSSFSLGQTDGYCSALGGSPIGMTDVCDIGGKVVKVE